MGLRLVVSGLFFLSLQVCGVSSYTEFEITVPNAPQVALHGQSIILSCSFSVGNSWQLSSSVITWQRGLEVIHSFYHSEDQLDRQSPHFANRTSLFISEISKGNASLKLDRITPEDAGIYTCSVSTQMGSQKKSFPLKIAAYYPEPRLRFSISAHGLDVFMSSEGGYPSPTLLWVTESAEDIANHTETHLTQDSNTKLYNVNSTLTLTGIANVSVTLILRNTELHQEIRRELDMNLISENGANSATDQKLLVILVVLLAIVIMAVLSVAILKKCRRRQQIKEDFKNGVNQSIHDSSDAPMLKHSNKDLSHSLQNVCPSEIVTFPDSSPMTYNRG